ncbi:MAG: hypothetical protein IH600_03160 [Bacteroidetes bacterium]|nr:hypothetical protein [Bacteroidota bacterium]
MKRVSWFMSLFSGMIALKVDIPTRESKRYHAEDTPGGGKFLLRKDSVCRRAVRRGGRPYIRGSFHVG